MPGNSKNPKKAKESAKSAVVNEKLSKRKRTRSSSNGSDKAMVVNATVPSPGKNKSKKTKLVPERKAICRKNHFKDDGPSSSADSENNNATMTVELANKAVTEAAKAGVKALGQTVKQVAESNEGKDSSMGFKSWLRMTT